MGRRYSKTDLDKLRAEGLCAQLPAPKRRKNDEWRLQYEVFQWWRSSDFGVPRHLFFHVPNGSVLGGTKWDREIRARMLKLTGMQNGVADCFLSVPRRTWHGMYIEFKTQTGKTSPEQDAFLASVEFQGYFTAVIRSFDDATKMISEYLKQ